MKTQAQALAQAQAEYNSAILGATALIKNALYNRKIVGKLTGKKFHTEGDSFKALTEVAAALADVSTYKGDGERNR
jgi:hypothetical protein